MFRRLFVLLASLALCSAPSVAQLLSRKTDIDFFRDVSSRQLKGLATRSDGRLVAGPTLGGISAVIPGDLLWCLEPTADPARWLVGTGPEGRIVELMLDSNATAGTARELVRLDDPQVFALKRLADGSLLAGTSPRGALYLIRDDQPVARALLPVDSIFDLLLVDAGTALAATGNPGRLYRIDLATFAAAGMATKKAARPDELAAHGITLAGEIRDRNIRRLALLADGRIAAGSSPKGNVYLFPCLPATAPPGAASSPDDSGPVILQENRDAEVTDLLPQPNGDLYATIVFSASTGESRITPPLAVPTGAADGKPPAPPPAQVERFGGRSALVWFPANGFPEVLTARSGASFYRMVRHGDTMIIAGGEQGELLGYDLNARLSLTFAGSDSAQLNSLAPIPGSAGKFLVLQNNAPGLALLDFSAAGPRAAETRRIDLGAPAQLGALRFNRLRHVNPRELVLELRTNNGSDEVEGWGPWTPLQSTSDGGWHAANLRGRHVKLRLRLPEAGGGSPRSAATSALEIDRASLFMLPQNRRPLMQDFRLLTPGFGVIPASEPPPPASISLSQVMQPPKEEERRRSSFLSSQVVPSPGTQVVLWTVTDPDGDNLLFTFSIRREDDAEWTDIVAATTQNYAQFSTSHLPDGIYFTRLVAAETAPRTPADRLTHTIETDNLIVDHTPPEVVAATAHRSDGTVVITVHGRDRLSLLDSIELVFNNGVRETVQQPVDGVRDGREETFRLEVPVARVSNATAVEVTLFDAAGNGTSRRLTW